MMTVDELKAKQAADMAKLKAEQALAALAPLPPRSVQLTSASLGHWISYHVADLWEALDVMAAYQPMTFNEYRGTFTRFVPASINVGKDAGEERSGPYVVKLDVSQGEGFGPTVYLAFFATVGDDVCMIRCELRGNDRFGCRQWHNFGASFQPVTNGTARRLDGQRYINGEFRANSNLSGMFDKVTKWGTGSREGAHLQYAMMADSDAGDWTDARLRLENVADVMHGPRKESAEVTSN